jgi:hypothetical protein
MAGRLMRLAMAPLAWRSLLVLGLAIVALAQLVWPGELPRRPPTPAAAPPAASGGGPETPPRTVYAAIAQHPLFDPTRSPYVAPKVPEPPAVPTLSPLREYGLLGIVIGKGTRIALLKPPANAKTVIATEGQAIDGWILRRITPGLLRFEKGGVDYEMRFAAPRAAHP